MGAYNPTLGRWINRDPIEQAGGVNLYSYVGNNPVNWMDPEGLLPKWVQNMVKKKYPKAICNARNVVNRISGGRFRL